MFIIRRLNCIDAAFGIVAHQVGHYLRLKVVEYIRTWIFRKWEGVETEWSWLKIGTGGGHVCIQ